MAKRNFALYAYIKEHPDETVASIAQKFGVWPESVTRAKNRLAYEGIATSVTPSEKTVGEMVAEDRRIVALRSEVSMLRSKLQEALKDSNTQEKLLEYNRLAIQAIPPVETPKLQPDTKKTSIESAVGVLSCLHIGEVINKDEMGGLNEYNFDVFCRRLEYWTKTAINFTADNMKTHTFDELRLFLTGDMVSGIIHDELAQTNGLNIVEQTTVGALVMAQAIQQMAAAFPRVIVTCVVGNHGRIVKEKYFKHKQQVNWDFIFYTNLSLLLANQKNVTFQIPLSFWAGVEVKGWNFMVQHGDLIKSWGGIPFYGINRAVSKWIEIEASQNRFFQYFVGSHFHNKAILQTAVGENILNASMKGGDEYATGLGLYSKPVQMLFGVHEKYGKTWELSINTAYGDTMKSSYHYNRSLPIAGQL